MQLSLPVDVSVAEIERKASLGAAITLCCDLAGLSPKQACDKMRTDKAQFSRWESGAEDILWPKLEALMDACGNDVPVMWQLQRRGYDLAALRKRESALEAECRTLREERDALKRVLLAGRA